MNDIKRIVRGISPVKHFKDKLDPTPDYTVKPNIFKGDSTPNKQGYDLTDNGSGKKYDTGKPMVGTLARVFPHALMAIGECIEFGTHKYPDPNNWKKVDGAKTRYLDSLMRHLLKHYMGITKDEETGLPHLAHAAWNALAILELELMN